MRESQASGSISPGVPLTVRPELIDGSQWNQCMSPPHSKHPLRVELVRVALQWQEQCGIAPAITSALSEFDAAMLVGHTPESYLGEMKGATAVRKGFDFAYDGQRYQVKANRPSGKPGSKVTKVGKPTNYDWDVLIWVLYNPLYEIQEVWAWPVAAYKNAIGNPPRLAPKDMQRGWSIL